MYMVFTHAFRFLQRIPQAWFLSRLFLYESRAWIGHIIQTINELGIVDLIFQRKKKRALM